MTRITVLAGGVGGARFTRGLLAHLRATDADAAVTVVANTGDDLWLTGLRVCPDLDSIMYTLGGANDDGATLSRSIHAPISKRSVLAGGVIRTLTGRGL